MMALTNQALGLGQTVATGLGMPMLTLTIFPGRYKYINARTDPKTGKRTLGKRTYVRKELYGDTGIHFQIPAWIVGMVGLGVIVKALGGIEKILSGESPNKDQEKAMDIVGALIPAVQIARWMGLTED